MSDRKYYVLCDMNCKFEGMTKEQILAAIEQATSTGEIKDVDTGFVTKLKESNKNAALSFWVGTQAEYNALETITENCFYIISDDTSGEDFDAAFAELKEEVKEMSEKITEDAKKATTELNNIKHNIGWAKDGNGGYYPIDRVINVYTNGWYTYPIDKYNCMLVSVTDKRPGGGYDGVTNVLLYRSENENGIEGDFSGSGTIAFRYDNASKFFVGAVNVIIPYEKEVNASGMTEYNFLTPSVNIEDSEGTFAGEIVKAILIL